MIVFIHQSIVAARLETAKIHKYLQTCIVTILHSLMDIKLSKNVSLVKNIRHLCTIEKHSTVVN